MTSQTAHMALQIFVEAYAIGADILAAVLPGESIDESDYVERCMNYGQQAFMQRRIWSEVSTSKLLFQNSWKLLGARGLTDESKPDYALERQLQAQSLTNIVSRVEVIRASAIATRGTSTIRDTIRGKI